LAFAKELGMARVSAGVLLLLLSGLLAACVGTNTKTGSNALSSPDGAVLGSGTAGQLGAGTGGNPGTNTAGVNGAVAGTGAAADAEVSDAASAMSDAGPVSGTGGASGASGTGASGASGTGAGAGGAGGASGTGGAAGSGGMLPCAGATPHGCYIAQSGNHPMCPANTPEQSAYYPPMAEWNGCNGIMPAQPFGQDPMASCSYKGPAGQIATCLCDTGLHWLCTYP
jgi:hypothetical protein